MPSEPFAMIPHRLSEDSRLDIYARDLYRHYATVAGQGYCAQTDATIARAMGVSPRSIRSARYRLLKCGYVKVEHRYHGSLKVWPLYVPQESAVELPLGPVLVQVKRHVVPTLRHVVPTNKETNKDIRRRPTMDRPL